MRIIFASAFVMLAAVAESDSYQPPIIYPPPYVPPPYVPPPYVPQPHHKDKDDDHKDKDKDKDHKDKDKDNKDKDKDNKDKDKDYKDKDKDIKDKDMDYKNGETTGGEIGTGVVYTNADGSICTPTADVVCASDGSTSSSSTQSATMASLFIIFSFMNTL
jgi:hypothetical protein